MKTIKQPQGAAVFDLKTPGRMVLNWNDNMIEVWFMGERLFVIDMNKD